MRVIAGEKGGRRLLAPSGRSTRPTSDRVREAMFSMLEIRLGTRLGDQVQSAEQSPTAPTRQHASALEEACVWDLFAGSGALGIEALSRGAAHATFVDQAPAACSIIRSNLAKLGYGPDRASVVRAEALVWAQGLAVADGGRPPPGAEDGREPLGVCRHPDLVMADPPYVWSSWPALLRALALHDPLVLMETGSPLELPEGWEAIRVKRYGSTLVTLTRPTTQPAVPPGTEGRDQGHHEGPEGAGEPGAQSA